MVISTIYQAALELPTEERAAFLDGVCGVVIIANTV